FARLGPWQWFQQSRRASREPVAADDSRLSLSLVLDHSCRMEKNPATFSTICRASSRVSSRPRRGCHSAVVRSIRLSLAALDGFTEHLAAGSAPLRASGLRSRNPTDDAGP